MTSNSSERIKQILLHLGFWCLILLFFTFVIGADNTINSNVLHFSLFLMPVTIATTYISIYKLIPNYLIKKKYTHFVVYSGYTLIISVFSICLSVFFGIAYLSNFQFGELKAISRSGIFIITCIYLVVIVVSAFKLLQLNLKQSKTNAELEARILEAQLKLKEQELTYLKMQIHPHFLFNTLNTVYGLSIKKSDLAPQIILKLSNLLDYLLYQVDKPQVALSEEINHIKDYIDLEHMRFNDRLKVNFTNQCNTNQLHVAPMLFLPFVENSFKHGQAIDGILEISITFQCTSNTIHFSITNNYQPKEELTPGIGLENIKRRLDLLYKDRYQLNITKDHQNFNVQLTLNLNPS